MQPADLNPYAALAALPKNDVRGLLWLAFFLGVIGVALLHADWAARRMRAFSRPAKPRLPWRELVQKLRHK